MREADGRVRQWVDNLSAPTRVTLIVIVFAIVIAAFVWG
jgi:hypothetical protein